MIRLAINGLGRIGRVAMRLALTRYADKVRIVAVNTSGSMETEGWGTLLKYDTVYGNFEKEVGWDKEDLLIEGERIPVLAQREPAKIPWNRYGVDVVLEATGVFRTLEEVSRHLDAGAKRVVISANAKGTGVPIYVKGVNFSEYKQETVISCSSCTTNCMAPICKVMTDNFEVEMGSGLTVHAVTAGQNLVDGSNSDLRRARSGMANIVPTTSGAGEAVEKIVKKLKGKFSAYAVRVPVLAGSYADLTFSLKKKVTVVEVNKLLQEAAEGQMTGVMAFSKEPLVSSDICRNIHSGTVDGLMTQVVGGKFVRIGAWYDNEWGYACRLLEEAIEVGEHAI